tara:strand:- start:156 stop:293 length:138 start_codon:yes stop_codon:yes gene_type:complete
MANLIQTIKTWFYELIEDAVGEKTMEKYKEEMAKKSNPQNEENSE